MQPSADFVLLGDLPDGHPQHTAQAAAPMTQPAGSAPLDAWPWVTAGNAQHQQPEQQPEQQPAQQPEPQREQAQVQSAASVAHRRSHGFYGGCCGNVSSVLSVVAWGLLAVSIWCATDSRDPSQPSTARTCISFIYMPILFCVFTYVAYLCTGYFTLTHLEIRRVYAPVSVIDRLERLRASTPVVLLQTYSYHFEQRTHTVTRHNPDGSTSPQLQTVNERVGSHAETEEFEYQSWTDESSDTQELHRYRICRIFLSKSFRLGSAATFERFQAQAAALCERNRGRDLYMDYSEAMHVEDYEEVMVGLADARKGLPYLLSERWYFVFLLLGLRWPYHWWYSKLFTARAFHLCKVVY